MTREQALDELVACEIQLKELTFKRHNLKRIVLGEIIQAQKTNPYPMNKVSSKTIRGARNNQIMQGLMNLGGNTLVPDLAKHLNLSVNITQTTLARLVKSHLVNREKKDGRAYYSPAIYRDEKELNHA